MPQQVYLMCCFRLNLFAIGQVAHYIVAGRTKVFWDTEVGLSGWRTAMGLLQSLAWQSVLEYYWHRQVPCRGCWLAQGTSGVPSY